MILCSSLKLRLSSVTCFQRVLVLILISCFIFSPQHGGFLVLRPGIEPAPPALAAPGVLTTGPSGKSLLALLLNAWAFGASHSCPLLLALTPGSRAFFHAGCSPQGPRCFALRGHVPWGRAESQAPQNQCRSPKFIAMSPGISSRWWFSLQPSNVHSRGGGSLAGF